jgi:hypothetical protein
MILAVSGTGKLGRRVVRVRGRESASMPRPRASPAFTHRVDRSGGPCPRAWLACASHPSPRRSGSVPRQGLPPIE